MLAEPSTGLDPQSRANLWQHILDLRAQHGTTVFLTTHYLEEADRYAERVMVMDKGRVIADDTAARLKANLAGDVVTLGFASADEAVRAVAVVQRLTDRDVRREGETSVTVTARAAAGRRPGAGCGRPRGAARDRSSADARRRLPRAHRTHAA